MSEVAICNQALTWLGANVITSLEDGTTESNLCNLHYGPIRDAVLEAHEWSFAIKRDTLQPLTMAPDYGFSHTFVKPTDCIRVLECRNDGLENRQNTLEWVLEGNHILVDSELLNIRYLFRETDTTRYTSMFTQAFAARLAADIAIAITQSPAMQQQMFQLYNAKMAEARITDGLQGRSRRIRFNELVNVRRF